MFDTTIYKDLIDLRITHPLGFFKFLVPKDRVTRSSASIFALWITVPALIMIFISLIFLKNQTRPISNLARVAEKFGKGQEIDNFKISGALEVRQAGKEFIKMKNRILKQIDQRSLMLAGVSHDLKTPLTRMKLIIETLENKDIKKDINDEINHMNEMLIE